MSDNKLQVKRITLDGSTTTIEFPFDCGKYLIKNFSDADIYVSFDETFTHDNSVKIPAGYFQVVEGNEWLGGEPFKTNEIYVEGTGEIEVQQLCFH
ncbi:MAG: hypothetical protein MJZ52_07120 [Bacteroidales bacterium]|nr:hypothetical protein [Bacteroidales bacterium]